jgi:hypothetical protein
MGGEASMEKIITENHSTPDARPSLGRYGQELEAWPRSWMGFAKDIPAGEKMVACFHPFLEYLIHQNLSRKTIRKHVDNLWILGGEIIRGLNETPSLRRVPVEDLVLAVVKKGGPLLHHCDSEEQQRSFESTCRKFCRFLQQQPP